MNNKEFLHHLKTLPEEDALALLKLHGAFEAAGLEEVKPGVEAAEALLRLANSNEALRNEVLSLKNDLAEREKQLEEHGKKIDELNELSTTDSLTGIANRLSRNRKLDRFFREALRGNIELAKHDNSPSPEPKTIAVLLFDIDHFKSVNDTYGHSPVGDEVIKSVAAQAQKIFERSYEFPARHGGEEFTAAILLETNLIEQMAMTRAETLRAAVEKNCKIWSDGSVGPEGKNGTTLERVVTISVGIAFLSPDASMRGNSVSKLGRLEAAADKALYAAKENGRNRVYLNKNGNVSLSLVGTALPTHPNDNPIKVMAASANNIA